MGNEGMAVFHVTMYTRCSMAKLSDLDTALIDMD
jgi:hypothetical protein